MVYTDSPGSDTQPDVSSFIHQRINHSKEVALRQNFRNQAKHVLCKDNGIDRKSFPLFLKECELQFHFARRRGSLNSCGIDQELRANVD